MRHLVIHSETLLFEMDCITQSTFYYSSASSHEH